MTVQNVWNSADTSSNYTPISFKTTHPLFTLPACYFLPLIARWQLSLVMEKPETSYTRLHTESNEKCHCVVSLVTTSRLFTPVRTCDATGPPRCPIEHHFVFTAAQRRPSNAFVQLQSNSWWHSSSQLENCFRDGLMQEVISWKQEV